MSEIEISKSTAITKRFRIELTPEQIETILKEHIKCPPHAEIEFDAGSEYFRGVYITWTELSYE